MSVEYVRSLVVYTLSSLSSNALPHKKTHSARLECEASHETLCAHWCIVTQSPKREATFHSVRLERGVVSHSTAPIYCMRASDTHRSALGKVFTSIATTCITLPHTATHCNTLQHTTMQYNALQLQRTANTQGSVVGCSRGAAPEHNLLQLTASQCNYCNLLQLIATHCNSLQRTAIHCNSLQLTATHCNSLQLTATHCNSLQHTQGVLVNVLTQALLLSTSAAGTGRYTLSSHAATRYNTLQSTAIHCNTQQARCSNMHVHILCREKLQYTATHYNTLQHTATHCNTLQHTALHCNTLHHAAAHCNTLQHTATHCSTLHYSATLCNTLHYTATHCATLQHTVTHCNTL